MKRFLSGLVAAVCVGCLGSLASPVDAAEVSVAVASNFAAPMRQIAAAFERDTGHKALVAYGSTGKLYAQIKNGAPFHVLLAADEVTPARLEREGLGVAGSRFTYAIGKLVLWSRQPGLVDDKGDVLRTGSFERLALADPKVAPYGAAAVETLTRLGLLGQLKPKFVQGEGIGQAYQFVASENAALGFVALSQVFLDGRITGGSGWIVPAHLYAPIRQDAVLLTGQQVNAAAKGAANPAAYPAAKAATTAAATALADYLRSDKARAIMRAYGYAF